MAAFILPKLYNANTLTIYGIIGKRFGERAKRANSWMFLVGQLFTSGSRLFIASIAISVIVFGDIRFEFLVWSIIILGVISTIYTVMGGIKGLLLKKLLTLPGKKNMSRQRQQSAIKRNFFITLGTIKAFRIAYYLITK